MDKIKIVIVSGNIDDKIKIKNLLDDDDFAISAFLEYDNMAGLKIFGYKPDIVILVYDKKEGGIFELAEQIYSQQQGISIIMLSANIDVELLKTAMQYGIKQILSLETTRSELKEAVMKSYNLEKKRSSENGSIKKSRSKVISFFGGKGGTGKTTIAVNTAVTLALSGKKTVIIDADLQFGDVTIMLNLDPKNTIYELTQEKGELNIDNIKSAVALHGSGLEVLAAPKSPELSEYINEKTIALIINILRPYFEYIIIDLPPGFNDTTISAIENSDIINMIANVDIISLRNSKVCMGILEAIRQSEKVKLILNRNIDGIIGKKDFESILGTEIILCLPDDSRTILPSMNKGIPFVMGSPRSAISKNIKAYAASI